MSCFGRTIEWDHPHAVDLLNGGALGIYAYDANGNTTCRTENGATYKQGYNTENRMMNIQKLAANSTCADENPVLEVKWDFAYDGDGVRVETMTTAYVDGLPQTTEYTRYYFGGAYEVRSDGTTLKYYSFGGVSIMRTCTGGTCSAPTYFLTDHLGSVVAVTDANGTLESEQRYLPFGQVREDVGSITLTDYGYTGQRKMDDAMGGIMDYKARFYSSYINHFIQPDTLIPDPASPQNLNRYSYVGNRPINFNDPSGHVEACGKDLGEACKHVDSLLRDYGITTGSDKEALTNQEKWAVLRYAIDIGMRFAGVRGGTPRDAFTAVYSNGVNVVKSSQTCQQALGEECWAQTKDTTITIFSNAGAPTSAGFRTMFIHEMGHVFDNTMGLGLSKGYKLRINNITGDGWTDMPTGCAGLSFHEGACNHSNIETAYLEQAADMFLGWVDGSFDTHSLDERRRANWANLWVGTFVLHPSPNSYPIDWGFHCNEDSETGAGCQPY